MALLLGATPLKSQTTSQRLQSGNPTAVTPAVATLPATQPTSTALDASETPAHHSAQRADINFGQGLLSVDANNSSLNQILREIGRLTSMKISGGVADERVYGIYGPAPAPDVLAALLEGTGSNMLLLQNSANEPAELVLTPRLGGATPPNPNAQAFDDSDPAPEQMGPAFPAQSQQPFRRAPSQLTPQGQQPQDTPPPPPSTSSSPAAPDPAAPSTSDPDQSASRVKTPQQIYEQLLKMQQQKQPK